MLVEQLHNPNSHSDWVSSFASLFFPLFPCSWVLGLTSSSIPFICVLH
jgi:hypothetical protein